MTTVESPAERHPDAEVGERVHQLIWRRRIQQAAVAQSLGMSASTLSRKLRGERPWTTRELIAAAEALNVSVGYLFGETTEAPSPDGTEGQSLPRLDSNQQPIGFKPGEVIDLAAHRRARAARQAAEPLRRAA